MKQNFLLIALKALFFLTPCSSFSCGFSGDTLIETATQKDLKILRIDVTNLSTSMRSLESIHEKILDEICTVVCYDDRSIPGASEITYQPITVLNRNPSLSCLQFEVEKDSSYPIICGLLQKFFVHETSSWLPALRIAPGYHLYAKDGTFKQVTARSVRSDVPFMYTLIVDQAHTFFVGRYRLIAHNAEAILIR